mmetsp:Transcript_24053/g.44954  ORF Transcript_24053/g.44954 Transcript_24053/m.44954 type:complete len:198 (-) Transcript_24053:354-947(-)
MQGQALTLPLEANNISLARNLKEGPLDAFYRELVEDSCTTPTIAVAFPAAYVHLPQLPQLPIIQGQLVETKAAHVLESKARKPRRKRRKKSPGAPRHPSSAFLYFSRENGELAHSPENFNPDEHWMTTLSRIWKHMSEEDKKPYLDKCAADKARYARELAEYHQSKKVPSVCHLKTPSSARVGRKRRSTSVDATQRC